MVHKSIEWSKAMNPQLQVDLDYNGQLPEDEDILTHLEKEEIYNNIMWSQIYSYNSVEDWLPELEEDYDVTTA
jgi:hypothetical protein